MTPQYAPEQYLGPEPDWTPEAVAAADCGEMVPMTPEQRRAANALPGPYRITGMALNLDHEDVRRIFDVIRGRAMLSWESRSLALIAQSPSDRWYITFNEPDKDHPEQWFHEASGEGELFREGELDDFLARFDIPTRHTILEIRNGFRIQTHADPPTWSAA